MAASSLLRGWSIYVVLPGLFMSLLEITQISQTATLDSQTYIGVFFQEYSVGQHICSLEPTETH